MIDFWVNILEILRKGKAVVLLYVIESSGSSPGRQGFRMSVSEDGQLLGSVGGGIMEHKLVERARALLAQGPFSPFSIEQVHQSDIPKNRSGMICSGSQRLAFYFLDTKMISQIDFIVQSLSENKSILLELTNDGLHAQDGAESIDNTLSFESESKWTYRKILGFRETIYIIGAGHVGLALSEIMNRLEFYVVVIDDREDLNTMGRNNFAHKKIVSDFNLLADHVKPGQNVYVAIMTFGYRTDEVCIKQLIDQDFKYIGVMGSREKMRRMLISLEEQNFSKTQINKLHTPIGLQINSKTPMEIAISVAAEIIQIRHQ